MSEDVAWINKQLKQQFGTDASCNQQFRVVWADSQLERRKCNYSETGIFLGEFFTEVREVPKYPYLAGKYVLETFCPVHGNPELVTKTSYEPLYVFQDSKGNPLPPLYKVSKYIIDGIRDRVGSSQSDAKTLDEIKEAKEIEFYKDYLEDAGSTPIGSHLSTGSGIIVPGDIKQ